MSQSRARKPQSVGGETVSKARGSMVKASGDSVPCASQNQPKHNQSSRSKNKIPKSIRLDLEKALVNLCDVWFDDIKPHLVRNNIKVHVDTNGASASGDFGFLPPAAPGCSHQDPGAASDRLQQTFANSAACSSTLRTASRAQCRRPPAQHPPPPPRPPPSSPLKLLDWTAQNKKNKSNFPRRARTHKKSSIPPPPSSDWRVPRLCRTHSLLSPQASPRTQKRRVHTAAPVIQRREEGCLLSLVPRRRTTTRNKYTQTEVPYTTKSYPGYQKTIKRANTNPTLCNTIPTPTVRHKHVINLMNSESAPSKNVEHPQRRCLDKRSNIGPYPPPRYESPVKRQNTELLRKVRREGPEMMDVDLVPSKTNYRHPSPEKRSKKEPIVAKTGPVSASQYRSRENRFNLNSAPQRNRQTQEKRFVDPSIAPPPRREEEKCSNTALPLPPRTPSPMTQSNVGNQFWRCFATTNLNPSKNKKQESQKNQKQSEIGPSMLFDKELVDIIGARNDKRLKVLFKSSNKEEFPSEMNLMPPLPAGRQKEASSSRIDKSQPWR